MRLFGCFKTETSSKSLHSPGVGGFSFPPHESSPGEEILVYSFPWGSSTLVQIFPFSVFLPTYGRRSKLRGGKTELVRWEILFQCIVSPRIWGKFQPSIFLNPEVGEVSVQFITSPWQSLDVIWGKFYAIVHLLPPPGYVVSKLWLIDDNYRGVGVGSYNKSRKNFRDQAKATEKFVATP